MELMCRVKNIIGDLFPDRGLISTDRYDEAKDALPQMKEQIVELYARNEQEKLGNRAGRLTTFLATPSSDPCSGLHLPRKGHAKYLESDFCLCIYSTQVKLPSSLHTPTFTTVDRFS